MEKTEGNRQAVIFGLLVLTLLITVFNTVQIGKIGKTGGANLAAESGGAAAPVISGSAVQDVIPKGTPDVYGKELGVNYDDISPYNRQKADASIRKLGILDNTISLSGDDLSRYINVAGRISCEYCCGAESIIFSNGQAACGCAHSYAMRGLAKYLITSHGDEYSDDEILEELGKWKTLFFPEQMVTKAGIMMQKGIEMNYVNLASNKYRDIEKGASSGGMVGGC
ncbi:MAG: hypothetical protein AABW87_02275 [Nanoarchaeota archaeon]